MKSSREPVWCSRRPQSGSVGRIATQTRIWKRSPERGAGNTAKFGLCLFASQDWRRLSLHSCTLIRCGRLVFHHDLWTNKTTTTTITTLSFSDFLFVQKTHNSLVCCRQSNSNSVSVSSQSLNVLSRLIQFFAHVQSHQLQFVCSLVNMISKTFFGTAFPFFCTFSISVSCLS